MYKYGLIIALTFSGCSYFRVNSTMCDQIQNDAGTMSLAPQECSDYDEKEAEKAFDKVVDEKKVSEKDIKFDKEENE